MTKTLEIDASTDESGSIHIRLPAPGAFRRVHVVVQWDERPVERDARGWPLAWFQEVPGSIPDPTFIPADDSPPETVPELE